MPKVYNLIEEKTSRGQGAVFSVRPDQSVRAAAVLMNDHRIGGVIVNNEEGRLVGVFTERDVLTRVVAQQRDPDKTTIAEVMTSPVVVCDPATPLEALRKLMREKRIRHVPAVERGNVVGMVTLGDLNIADARVLTETISYLKQYMHVG